MILPNNDFSFHFKSIGERTAETYEGDFSCSCLLSNEEQVDVAIRADRYNGGSKNLSENLKLFNRAIAEMDLRIKKAPTWWKESNGGWGLHDANVVFELFTEVMKGPEIWSGRLKEKADLAEKAVEKNPAKKADAQSASG